MDQSTRQTMPPRRKNWLGAFAHPGFVVVWAASTIALIGIAMYDTASGWLMTTLDLNPFDVSLVHAATNLPMFLFTLPAGALADIVDPRRLILAVSCVIAALVAIFAGLVSLDLATPLLLLLDDFPAQRRLGAEPSGLALDPAEPGPEIRPARSDRRRRGRLQPEPHGRSGARRLRDRQFRHVDALLGVRRRQSRGDRRSCLAAGPLRGRPRPCRRSA